MRKEEILEKPLDNAHRKNIKEIFGDEIDKCYGNSFNEKLFNFIYSPITTYGNKKLEFINFKTGYDFTPNMVTCEQDVELFFSYIFEFKKIKGLITKIRKNLFLSKYFDGVRGESNSEKYFRIKHKIFKEISCKNCDNKAKFQIGKGFTFCSHSCAQRFEETITKRRKTNIEKYGVEEVLKCDEILDKIASTNIEKYGVDNVFKLKYLQESILEERDNKTISEKRKSSFKKKYGVEFNSQLHITNIEDYFSFGSSVEKFLKDGIVDIEKLQKYFNISRSLVIAKLKENNIEYRVQNLESKINEYFDNIFVVCDRNFIKPLEIDLLSYEYSLGIEFNGLFWHSFGVGRGFSHNIENMEERKYHLLEKLEKVERRGFELVNIFENEWNNKRDLCISTIKRKLELDLHNVEDFYIRKINPEEAYIFFEENHILGGTTNNINIGAFDENDEMVSCLGIQKFEESASISRFCDLKGVNVIGGIKKLLEYSIGMTGCEYLSYDMDRRWNLHLPEEICIEIGEIKPNFFFTKNDIFYSKILMDYMPMDYLLDNGYRIIYDCGIKTYRIPKDML